MTQSTTGENVYQPFLASVSRRQWQKIGLNKRAGVCAPLFSLYSKKSTGIGEIPDLKLLTDWCSAAGMSIIQLLPMNDVGYDFRPYDAQSTFALEPMYLSLERLEGVKAGSYRREIQTLRRRFKPSSGRVDYGIKAAKMDLLWKMFQERTGKEAELESFRERNRFWIEDYALFKVIKGFSPDGMWENWDEPLKKKDPEAMERIRRENGEAMLFYIWLQWQLYEQFRQVKEDASSRGIFLMGDLPFLVSRDSADVWANQGYFKLDRVSGAPPDAYIAEGQRWGMPPYAWENIAAHGFDYLREKIRYAQNFYDMFRIDHVVGVFRLWTIASEEPPESGGRNGKFDPEDESRWEEHGRKLLSVMIENTEMLPCAEDLGVVPDCSYVVLREFAVPGMDVQRWRRHWDNGGDFVQPSEYRPNSIAVISTHDMPCFLGWWFHELGCADPLQARTRFTEAGLDFDALQGQLFEAQPGGLLKWKPQIRDENSLAAAAGRSPGELNGVLQLWKTCLQERRHFLDYLGLDEKEASDPRRAAARALERAHESRSIFSVQLLQDWLSPAGFFTEKPWDSRINFPGTMNERNWSLVMPLSLEELCGLELNAQILRINRETGRI